MAVVQVLTSLTSRDPAIMHLLRCLYYYLALHNIQLKAEHIPGVQNTIADSISRNVLQVFRAEPCEGILSCLACPLGGRS